MTAVFIPRIARSINTYNKDGTVENAVCPLAACPVRVRPVRHAIRPPAPRGRLTAEKQREGRQRPVLGLEALQQRRESEDVHQGVEEAEVDEGERGYPVHWSSVVSPRAS